MDLHTFETKVTRQDRFNFTFFKASGRILMIYLRYFFIDCGI